MGNDSMIARALASGWQLSGIYTSGSGPPLAVTSSGCNASTYPGQGQCMPDLSPGSIGKNARINGSYGSSSNGTVAANLGKTHYVDSTAFKAATHVPTSPFSHRTPLHHLLLQHSPHTRAYNL